MFYIITEKIRDGEYEYYCTCIIKLEEGEEPSEELFLKKLYGDSQIQYNSYSRAWEIHGDYRLANIYSWKLIESEEDKLTLNKYGIY